MAKDYEFSIDDSDFVDKVAKIQRKFPDFMKYLLNRLGARLLAKVRKLTPVGVYPSGSGKVGGNLRRKWFMKDPVVIGDENSVEILNNEHYALPVEMGHQVRASSKKFGPPRFVPGRFMLKRAFAELEPVIPNIVELEMQIFIDKNGGGR